MTDIYNKFMDTAESRRMFSPGDRILLSLSAGKDSMALLDLMLRHGKAMELEFGIFHLNHLTRGRETDMDEALVRDKSEKEGIPFFGRKFDFRSGKIAGVSFEEQARDVRYAILNEICRIERYNKIATAHNSRDNVETLLMRIFSGTGLFGLRGISHINGKIIRPLLDISPDEIYSYLKERKIEWREDSSNSGNDYLRNYTRNIIIPAVTERFPDAEYNINRLAGHADENENLISFLAGCVNPEWLIETETGHFISTSRFSQNIPFVKYMLSRTILSNYGLRLNSAIFDEIIRRYKTGKSHQILYCKGELVIRKSLRDGKTGIEIADLTKKKQVPDKWEYKLKIENQFSIFITELDRYLNCRKSCYEEFTGKRSDSSYIFLKMPDNVKHIILRNRRDGDRIVLEKGSKKIKELMIEKKLDTGTKKSVPLIVINDEIAAYLPGAVESYPDRVSCNFWIDDCTDNMFVFYFADSADFNII